VYVVERGIFRTDLAGATYDEVEPLTVDSAFFGLGVDDVTGWRYWTERSPQTWLSEVRGRDHAGQQTRLIASAPFSSEFNAVTVDATIGKIYWTSAADSGSILRANLDGSAQGVVLTDAGPNLTALAVDSDRQRLYWITRTADQTAGSIRSAAVDTPVIQDIVATLVDPRGIAVDATGQALYWSDAGTGKIQRSDLQGGNVQDVLFTAGEPYGLAYSGPEQLIYWVDHHVGTLAKIRPDGSNAYVLRSGLPSPVLVDVWIPPGTDSPNDPLDQGLQVIPNPFRGETSIQYVLARHEGSARLTIYDVRGRFVTRLLEPQAPRGILWAGVDDRGIPLQPGLYFLRLNTNHRSITRKILRLP